MTIENARTVVSPPGQPLYEQATRVFNLAAPARPVAATIARDVDDVRHALAYAREAGLKVQAWSTGHGSAGAAPLTGSLLIRTEFDEPVTVDPERRSARIPAGAPWGAVVAAAGPYGLTAPHGSSPLVGAVGYLLQGGLSFYGRQAGLAVNAVTAVELVTADGQWRRIDAGHEPELFWAVRGGGVPGVVTAVEIDLFPVSSVVTGAAFWPARYADRLLAAWQAWTLDAPRCATTSLRVMNLPTLPGVIPAELSAGTVLCVDGAFAAGRPAELPGTERLAEDLLGPLRSVAPPVMDTWQTAEPAAVLQTHMDPAEPITAFNDHLLLGEIGGDGASAFLAVVGEGSGSPLVDAELRQLGGAFAEPVPGGGALDHLSARYAYVGAGLADSPVVPPAVAERHAMVRTALTPWDTGRTAPTFAVGAHQRSRRLDPARAEAVAGIRQRFDPDGLFDGGATD